MRAVGIKILKNKLSEYVRLAAAGETVLVTDRDRVVAELGPPRPGRAESLGDARLAEAVRRGWLAAQAGGPARRPPARAGRGPGGALTPVELVYLDTSVLPRAAPGRGRSAAGGPLGGVAGLEPAARLRDVDPHPRSPPGREPRRGRPPAPGARRNPRARRAPRAPRARALSGAGAHAGRAPPRGPRLPPRAGAGRPAGHLRRADRGRRRGPGRGALSALTARPSASEGSQYLQVHVRNEPNTCVRSTGWIPSAGRLGR